MTRLFISLYFFAAFYVTAHESSISRDTSTIVIKIEPVMMDSIRITYYEPDSAQCYGNPLITATGEHIDINKLSKGEIRTCAISRDLEDTFAMGDSIDIYIREGHPWNGRYKVNDRVNKRWTKTVDILSNTFKSGCYKGKISEI